MIWENFSRSVIQCVSVCFCIFIPFFYTRSRASSPVVSLFFSRQCVFEHSDLNVHNVETCISVPTPSSLMFRTYERHLQYARSEKVRFQLFGYRCGNIHFERVPYFQNGWLRALFLSLSLLSHSLSFLLLLCFPST